MTADMTPWAIFAGFVIGLISLVGWGIRLMARGRLVPGVIYDDVRGQRDAWKTAAETYAAASAEMSAHVARLVSAVEQLTAVQRETTALVRQLVGTQSPSPNLDRGPVA
jgi:type IV secretory pathway TrbF-like protein